jgi:UDP-galactopyranose mutase
VFNFLSRFTSWENYQHKVKAILNCGTLVTLPINKETKRIVGTDNLIDTFIRPYSEKMWGMSLENLDPQITNRIPMRDDDNDLYFPNDKYQGVPSKGYTNLFENLIKHPNISLQLNVEFSKVMEVEYMHVFNSMPIDEYYDFCLGPLPYRSLKFHTQTLPIPRIFPVSQINFTNDQKFTRVIEWKNIPFYDKTSSNYTTITFEEPCDYRENNDERYYPIKDINGTYRKLYEQYRLLDNSKITFIGRLGLYAYLDMHQVINSSMQIAKQFLNPK